MTQDGRPKKVNFTFDDVLEDESMRWVRYQDGQFVPFEVPAVGQTTVIEAVPSICFPHPTQSGQDLLGFRPVDDRGRTLESDAAGTEGVVGLLHVSNLVIDDRSRMIELVRLGKSKHEPHLPALEKPHPGRLEQELHL